MVLDPADPDTVSAGSFFLNPVLDRKTFEQLVSCAQARWGAGVGPPAFPQLDGRIKTSAAWLIEHAGYHRGYGDPNGIAISSKHTLALTNRGGGTTAELLALAREIADGVREQFGVALTPEPVLVGHSWDAPDTVVKYDDFQTV
jgi:UDP-N-acetylmuramate dehydrogenase